ncbi:GDSL-type esterase/lipase family protein [Runella slithyformis]|uniref:Lipolytic protein G-D-S-L family n=1 Tax=Runella slithyformis (strain ATCC 29530 / DSM 19594 / LMG 11500 / NCIMB 11436 / LSU 4) TaxID=761193 RepID=A0A7U3ZLB7_RUNSL|nr:GDSL-type esterase/lipase family protein [Runella slithyformis]AEI49322.1 lipolytic protein G-D-S-L family [Runella slithyformis DSM 19594]
MIRTLTLFLFGLALMPACHRSHISYKPIAEPFEPDYQVNRFESEIKNFEKESIEKGISKGHVLFYGSSSWRFWKNIKTDLAPLPIINHGFGGSTIPELIHYADRAVFPYQPKLLVIYGGENDLSGQKYKSPEQMYDTYRQLTALVQNRLPKTKICFVSMKLSPSRRKHWEAVKKGNAMVKAFSKGKYLSYVDINPVLFNADGTVKSELYTQDSLHLNAQGYREYAKILLPFLTKKYR